MDTRRGDDEVARVEGEPDPARRIISATRRIIGEGGFEAARITDIAREAGVARGAIFYYFRTKEHLLTEVLRVDADERLASLEQHLAPVTSLDELVRGMVGELVSFLDAERASHVLVQQIDGVAMGSQELRTARQQIRIRWRQGLREILNAKAQAGVIRLDAEAEVVGAVLSCLGHGIANEVICDPDWDPAPAIALGERLARAMLAPAEL